MKAFVVIGPESSGTRIVTRLFCAVGCLGGYEHVQPLDCFIENGGDFPYVKGRDIVFRRSVPHANQVPDICRIQDKFEREGFDVYWIIVIRDWYCTIASAAEHKHKCSNEKAANQLPQEWAYIGMNLGNMKRFYFLLSSQMMLSPERALIGLERYTKLEFSLYTDLVRDADVKHFG